MEKKKLSKAERQQVTLRISKPLHKALKAFSARKNITMTDFVEGLISKSLKKN